MLKGGLLWLIGIPLPVIILNALFANCLRAGFIAIRAADHRPFFFVDYSAAAGIWIPRASRSCLISSAVMKAISSACSAFSRGSQKV